MTSRAILFTALGLAVFAAGILAYSYVFTPTCCAPPLPELAIGGDFELASSKGGTVKNADLKGKPYAMFFGFTHCPEVCPTTLYELSTALGKLGEEARDLRVFFVTVDPERDTVEKMRDYISSFDPRLEALVPTQEQLPKVAKGFRVYYAKVPTSDGGYTMDHSASVYLYDAEGAFAGTLAFGEAEDARLAKLRKLLGV